MIRIAVICFARLTNFPPVQSLIISLLKSGYCVDAFLFGDDTPLGVFASHGNLRFVSLGDKQRTDGIVSRGMDVVKARKIVRDALRQKGKYDLVWTTTDVSARDAGNVLFEHRHIMQLMELVEYTPLIMDRAMPLHSALVPRLARAAKVVVVPEYNRSFIQQSYWDLPEKPTVLPNKSVSLVNNARTEDSRIQSLSKEKRKVLLYQGVIGRDRDLEAISRATELLGQEYVFIIMGRVNYRGGEEYLGRLVSQYQNTEYLGYIPAPQHLDATPYGYIGLLPYSIKRNRERYSPLNALYCAPNKIWEYSRFGLPMLAADVPGLTSLFSQYGVGRTVDFQHPEQIADEVRKIARRYEEYRHNSKLYFDSVDYDRLVQLIVERALE